MTLFIGFGDGPRAQAKCERWVLFAGQTPAYWAGTGDHDRGCLQCTSSLSEHARTFWKTGRCVARHELAMISANLHTIKQPSYMDVQGTGVLHPAASYQAELLATVSLALRNGAALEGG